MNKQVRQVIGAGVLGVLSISANAADSMKAEAVDLLHRGLEQGNTSVIESYVAEDYIQHNPLAEDGRAGLIGFTQYLKTLDAPPQIDVVRVLQEDDLVVVHSRYNLDSELAIFDLFRVEDGVFVEHWDGVQPVPESTVSGRSMFDGPVAISDRDNTQQNKKLVADFVHSILVKGEGHKLSQFIGDTYHQHNPNIDDGAAGIGAFMQYLADNQISFGYTKVHNVVAEGNFVFTQSEGVFDGKPTAFYDLFRVEGGKIVEHWDAIQAIPEKMKHDNGMF